jgi:hypothetical protein
MEYGTVELPLAVVAERVGNGIIEDAGIRAVVLDPGPEMPVTFVSEPAIDRDAVAIVADLAVERSRLRQRVEAVVGADRVRWYPEVGVTG